MRKNGCGFLIFLSLLIAEPCYASRVITFFGSADNEANYGLMKNSPPPANCSLTINNQSGNNQNYTILISSIAATGLSGGIYTLTTVPPGLVVGSAQTIADGSSHNYTFSFPAIPGLTMGKQHIDCNGKISIQDTGAPGSLGFYGFIRTISEEKSTEGTSAASATTLGSAPALHTTPLASSQN